MYKVNLRKNNRIKRKLKIRSTLKGTPDRPRLSVFRSNKFVYGQLIDDTNSKTLLSVDNQTKEIHKGKNKQDAAFELGKLIAKKAKEANINAVVFDRNGYIYHGRVKKVADGAREGGLIL